VSVVIADEVIEVEEDPTWYWRLTQPIDDTDASGDVDLELAPIFYDWDGDDLRRLMHVIARKLQYTASMLLSAPLEENNQ
jgi:hypothetical protein